MTTFTGVKVIDHTANTDANVHGGLMQGGKPQGIILSVVRSMPCLTTTHILSVTSWRSVRQVFHILLMGARSKVSRVDTSGRIALMEQFHSLRNRANEKFIGDTVSVNNSLPSAASLELAIAFSLASSPKPTSVSLEDVRPKPICNSSLTVVVPVNKSTAGYVSTPTLTEFGRIISKWYSVHVVDLLNRLTANPRTFAASLGFSMPNYSTNGGTK